MEIDKTIQDLKLEVKKIQALILALEALRRGPARGRPPKLFTGFNSATDSTQKAKRAKAPRKTKQNRGRR